MYYKSKFYYLCPCLEEHTFRKPTFYPLNYKGLCRFAQIFKELLPIIQRIDWAEKSVTL